MKLTHIIIPVISFILLSGCVTTASLNQGFRKIDRVWALEYQKTEDLYRYRVVDAPYEIVYQQVKKTFLDLSMPLVKKDFDNGLLIAENEAPNPLTKEEWLQVREIENPRTKETGGWMFTLPTDPSDYIITVAASLTEVNNKTFILIDYKMSNPKYTDMGLEPSEYAPPLAVQLGSVHFWDTLQGNLKNTAIPAPRKVAKGEFNI